MCDPRYNYLNIPAASDAMILVDSWLQKHNVNDSWFPSNPVYNLNIERYLVELVSREKQIIGILTVDAVKKNVSMLG